MHPVRLLAAALAGSIALAGGSVTHAVPADPAVQRIDALDAALLETMKGGATLGAKGRYRRLTPVVEQTFDLPVMTAFAVGPSWATMTPADKQALIHAFGRLTAASYAHNFDAFGGERFEVDPAPKVRGADKIVQARIVPAHGDPTPLSYRMRETADGWKVIDVIYGAISQLTNRRADFTASVTSGGAKGLLAHLDALTAKLLG